MDGFYKVRLYETGGWTIARISLNKVFLFGDALWRKPEELFEIGECVMECGNFESN